DGRPPPGPFVGTVMQNDRIRYFSSDRRPRPMSKPLVPPALAHFVASTAGRNMTRPAYVAVGAGVAMMVLLTVDPAYEAAHHWVDAVLWACLAFFLFEWVVRLQYASKADRLWTYALSGGGLFDGFSAPGIT